MEKKFLVLQKFFLNFQTSSKDTNLNERKIKLPKLELKKFSGEVKDWVGFWGQFSKIDYDKALNDSDKLQYLIQSSPEIES